MPRFIPLRQNISIITSSNCFFNIVSQFFKYTMISLKYKQQILNQNLTILLLINKFFNKYCDMWGPFFLFFVFWW